MRSPSIVVLRTQSDHRLVALARAGHERAFEAIVDRYRRPLLRACRRVLPDARAEDALQHALVAAWGALRRGDDVQELRPWLYRIARNTALNQLRTSGYDHDGLSERLPGERGPDEALEHRMRARTALARLSSLPDRQRDALVRVALHGRSHAEVADDLGLSQGAVRQLVHRARIALRTACGLLVPPPLVAWLATSGGRGEPLGQRVAELVAGAGSAGATAFVAKGGTAVIVAGGLVVGPPPGEPVQRRPPVAETETEAETAARPSPTTAHPRAAAPAPAPAPARVQPAPAAPRAAAVVERPQRRRPAIVPPPAAPAPVVEDEDAEEEREELEDEAAEAQEARVEAQEDAAEEVEELAEEAEEELEEEAEEELDEEEAVDSDE